MIDARRNVRARRARSLGIECLEDRAVLSGITHVSPHHAAAVAAAAAKSAAAAAKIAAAPPTLVESHLLRDGNTVTGLVMTFSKPLDPATTRDLNNYVVYTSGPAVGHGAVNEAVYNPAQNSITLMLAQPLTIKPAHAAAYDSAFTVASASVRSPDGSPEPNDIPGSSFGYKSASTITDTSGQRLSSNGNGPADGGLFAGFYGRRSAPKGVVTPHMHIHIPWYSEWF